MELTQSFLIQTLNTVKNNIAVVDDNFHIVYTNKAWDSFAVENGCSPDFNWVGTSYFKPCQTSALDGDEFGIAALEGIEQLRKGEISEFQLEYPCHSPSEDRWFIMEIDKFILAENTFFVISHQNITKRVTLEQEAMRLSKVDGLTGIANRRAFDDFIELEWHQCMRNQFPLSLMLVDIDNFKSINDTLGHQVGDACLKAVSRVLEQYTGRASDISARYGGDEFMVVWGHVTFDQSEVLSSAILNKINQIEIINSQGQLHGHVSASIGLCSTIPSGGDLEHFITTVDRLMYQAKQSGKNKVISKLLKPQQQYSTRVY